MTSKLSFKKWFGEMVGTGAIYDGSKGTFNWWGTPGSTGKVIDGDPIKSPSKKKKKRKKNCE